MTNARPCCFVAAGFTLLLFSSLSFAQAGKISIRMQLADRTTTIRGYDSSGVVFVSVQDYASTISIPCVTFPDRKKAEVRLPNDRVKLTAGNPFLVITNVPSGTSSIYQMCRDILYLDSMYYAAASQFVPLLERLSPSGVSLDVESRLISKQPASTPPQFDITGLGIEPRLNGYLLTIKASRKLGNYDAFLKSDGWLYVTVADAEADTTKLGNFKTGDIIRQVLVFQSPTSVQLTFKVSPEIVEADPMIDSQTQNLLLALHTRTPVQKAELEKAELDKKHQDETRGKLQLARSRARLDVIVIDAGHGGKDPGTIGVAGTREKDVALGVALKLGRLLEQGLKDVKVIYTRKNDTFIELYRRAQIANEANGKLFISIHCNSTERKPSSANGFEIYLLRPGKTENAVRIAEKENEVVKLEENPNRYQKLTEENFILVTMRQSAFVKYSEEFAEKASETMANLLKIQNSGVKQAGFYVLVGASMPNVLVETGYLSNRKEEKVLRSADGQMKIADAIFQGIKKYKTLYEEALQEGQPANPEGK